MLCNRKKKIPSQVICEGVTVPGAGGENIKSY